MTTLIDRTRRPTRRAAVTLVALFTSIAVVGFAITAILIVRSTGASAESDPNVAWAISGVPVQVGAAPADVEAGGGFIWVSNSGDGTLTRIDPVSRATSTVVVGGQPGQIVVGEGAVWVRNLGDRITRVDLASGAISPPLAAGSGPISGMAVGNGAVWLSHRDGGVVTRLDAHTLNVAGPPIRVGAAPGVMEFDDGAVFVLDAGDGSLSRIDAATANRTGTASVGRQTGGLEVDRGDVYVAADGGIVPVDARSLTPRPPLPLEGLSYFEVHDGIVWVLYDEDARIERVDAATGAPVGEPFPAPTAEIGHARFAFDHLWLTVPGRDEALVVGVAR
ncbi:hypothetical protein ACFPK1_12575 [Actinomycetospora rhizophila]|uniref:Uncharacterized protein n=1 Tax=Actinomycetospora rhizophila TaxID=1416876 RepID=A0ABV9ZCE7_9PSEU